jgi:hypothetical protein
MYKIMISIVIAAMTIATSYAQNQTFEDRAKEIGVAIKTIATEEKEALKKEIETIDNAVKNGTMTKETADKEKQKIATERAKNIETRTATQEKELRQLIKDGLEIYPDTTKSDSSKYNLSLGLKGIKIKDDKNKSEKRTTSQFVFAFGFNSALTDGEIDKNYQFSRSSFFEWGVSWNTRLSQNSNLAHFKYGLSFMYNNLTPTENRVLVDTGSQTVFAPSGLDFDKNKFRSVHLVMPLYFELDFSKTNTIDDKKIFRSHEGFRLGLGGFAGVRTNTKYKTEYSANGSDFETVEKANFNTNNFTYGLGAYIGHKQTSLYVKYDLNPIFKNNALDSNNISFGVRFDWN